MVLIDFRWSLESYVKRNSHAPYCYLNNVCKNLPYCTLWMEYYRERSPTLCKLHRLVCVVCVCVFLHQNKLEREREAKLLTSPTRLHHFNPLSTQTFHSWFNLSFSLKQTFLIPLDIFLLLMLLQVQSVIF